MCFMSHGRINMFFLQLRKLQYEQTAENEGYLALSDNSPEKAFKRRDLLQIPNTQNVISSHV